MTLLVLEEIQQFVIKGNAAKAKEYVEKALQEGLEPLAIINDGLIAGMNVIGVRFKANEIYVPEVLIAARAMHSGMSVVKPLIANAGIAEKGTIVIGTVKGDLHDIGKNLVTMMLEGAGYKVIDIGVDVPTEKFIKAVEEHKPQLLGLSALLTTTMVNMKTTIEQLRAAGLPVKVMVGGAPVTEKFAAEIGADAYATDAATAVDKAHELIEAIA